MMSAIGLTPILKTSGPYFCLMSHPVDGRNISRSHFSPTWPQKGLQTTLKYPTKLHVFSNQLPLRQIQNMPITQCQMTNCDREGVRVEIDSLG